jgi:nucleoside-diphosphate-sugar epimerase
MRVLVTGSAGLIGFELVAYFDERASSVIGIATICAPTSSVRRGRRGRICAASGRPRATAGHVS